MTFLTKRTPRTLATMSVASAMLLAVPAGAGLAAAPVFAASTDIPGMNEIKEILEKAPELKGATVDVSGLTVEQGEMTAENAEFTATGKKLFFDSSLSNPKDPKDPNQPNKTLNSISESWLHTDTTSFTAQHEVGTSVMAGMSFKTEGGIPFLAGTEQEYKVEVTVSYKYTSAQTFTKTDTSTITATAQTAVARPGRKVRIVQWTDIGNYEADLTMHATLRGNVVVTRCGTRVSMPIGRLASLTRDEDQDPLFPTGKPDGDALRLTSVVHWKADLASSSRLVIEDTVLTDDTYTPIPQPTQTPSATPSPQDAASNPTATPHARKASRVNATVHAAAEPKASTLRNLIPCAISMDLDTNGGAPHERGGVPAGTRAIGNHTFLTPDKNLMYYDRTIDRNVASAVGAWASYSTPDWVWGVRWSGEDWVSYVRDDGRAYTNYLNPRYSQFERSFPVGTRAVGFRVYLTPQGDLYYSSRRVAQNVSSAIAGWSGSEWVTFVSGEKGYYWAPQWGEGAPAVQGTYAEGTVAVGNHTFLSPDGSLRYYDRLIGTEVTSVVGGWGPGPDWAPYVSNGRGHSWDSRSGGREELFLSDDAEAVGNHTYLDSNGYLYYVDNEVAHDVKAAVGGWGAGGDWISFIRESD